MRRRISVICSSGNAANVLKPTNRHAFLSTPDRFCPAHSEELRFGLLRPSPDSTMRGWSKTMAKEELKWQNIDADDLPTYRGKEIFRCVRRKFML
jgi:hypothetical protein